MYKRDHMQTSSIYIITNGFNLCSLEHNLNTIKYICFLNDDNERKTFIQQVVPTSIHCDERGPTLFSIQSIFQTNNQLSLEKITLSLWFQSDSESKPHLLILSNIELKAVKVVYVRQKIMAKYAQKDWQHLDRLCHGFVHI